MDTEGSEEVEREREYSSLSVDTETDRSALQIIVSVLFSPNNFPAPSHRVEFDDVIGWGKREGIPAPADALSTKGIALANEWRPLSLEAANGGLAMHIKEGLGGTDPSRKGWAMMKSRDSMLFGSGLGRSHSIQCIQCMNGAICELLMLGFIGLPS